MSSRRVERATRAADRDMDVQIEQYLAMYRPKPLPIPLTSSIERTVEVGLWILAITATIGLACSVVYSG